MLVQEDNQHAYHAPLSPVFDSFVAPVSCDQRTARVMYLSRLSVCVFASICGSVPLVPQMGA